MKRPIIVISIIVILLILSYLIFQYRKSAVPLSEAIIAVPADATLIFSSKDISGLWRKISETNLIWQELSSKENYFDTLHQHLQKLDSLFAQDEALVQLGTPNPLLLSIHPDHAGEQQYLFLARFDIPLTDAGAVKFLRKINPESSYSSRELDDKLIHTIEVAGEPLNFYIHNNLFIASMSVALLEQSLMTIHSGLSLRDDPGFAEIISTSGSYVDAGVIINYRTFAPALSRLLSDEGKSITLTKDSASGWSALDLTVKPDALMLNGFTTEGENSDFLSHFQSQKPQQISFTRIIPRETRSFLWFGFSHTPGWLHARRGPDGAALFSWVESEAAALTVEGSGTSHYYNIFKAKNPPGVLETNWYSSVHSGERESSFTHLDFTIKRFPIKKETFADAFGQWFGFVDNPYAFAIGPYVVMASDSLAALFFIDRYQTERTLGREESFRQFSDNLSEEANIYIYSAIARSIDTYESVTVDSVATQFEEKRSLYAHFEAAGIQLGRSGEKFYTSAYLRYNPEHKESRTTFWEAVLKAPLHGKPWIVTNHNDQTREVFVQDSLHNIYLFDNKGLMLWQKDLESRIMGDVRQVDVYRNGKLQLLFHTAEKIFLIDRNGNTVSPFPVSLPATATAPMALFDYDRNLDYRLLIPLADQKVHNYDLSGKELAGFTPIEMEANIGHEPLHVALNGKDYILVFDQSGKVVATDRRGELRLNLREKLPPGYAEVCIDKGKDLPNTYLVSADSAGRIFRLSLADVPEIIKTGNYSPFFRFNCFDVDADGVREFAYADTSGFALFGSSGNLLFEHRVSNSNPSVPQYFRFPDGLVRVGFTDISGGNAYLFTANGKAAGDFPVQGHSAFAIADLNRDEKLNLVIAGPGKTLFVYNLKE